MQPYHNRRFDSDFLTTMKVIESGKLGEILEIESNYDYYRAEVPENVKEYDGKLANTFLYGHGTHVLDQIISRYGKPNKVHYDVRQLLGTNRMNDLRYRFILRKRKWEKFKSYCKRELF